jgi:hypothetical protein
VTPLHTVSNLVDGKSLTLLNAHKTLQGSMFTAFILNGGRRVDTGQTSGQWRARMMSRATDDNNAHIGGAVDWIFRCQAYNTVLYFA